MSALNRLAENIPVQRLLSLEGRVALVTGGAGRYGRSICRALAEAGANVLVGSRDVNRCRELTTELLNEGWTAEALEIDIADPDSVNQNASVIERRWGHLDALFNNAVTISTGGVSSYSIDEWRRVMDVNSDGLFLSCKIFGAMMARHRTGSIVNIGSIYGSCSPDFRIYDGFEAMTSPPSYSFVKGGMVQLSRYMAVHFAKWNVRVNCLSPGGLESPGMSPEFVSRYTDRVPLGRMANRNDLKGAAVFFASDASAYITGQNLLLDGGYSAI